MLGEFTGSGSGITKGLWHLNGNSTDSSGNGNNGTDSNITYGLAYGKFGQGASFNGSSSVIQTAAWSPPGNYTISMWINADTLPASGGFMSLFCNYDVPTTLQDRGIDLRLYNDNGTQKIQTLHGIPVSSGSSALLSYSTTLSTSTWYLLNVVYNGTTVKLYLNANEVATANMAVNIPAIVKLTNIGNFGYYTTSKTTLSRYFNGSIDEVIVENRAWTAEQVKKYYSASKGRWATL
jgi:hypothetical protein